MQRLAEVAGDPGVDLVVEVAIGRFRIHQVMTSYSSPVSLDVTADLETAAGGRYRLVTFRLDENRWGLWVPGQAVVAMPGDVLVIEAPSGGVGVVATVAVYGGLV